MDRRGWPWKKKSSEKSSSEKPGFPSDSSGPGTTLAKAASLGNQDYKKVNYVQIPLESYKHLTSLEDQVNVLENHVKTLEHQVKDLEGKLSTAYLEVSTQKDLVKQHTKVAEEAVSGWEKADAEAHALKQQLESVTLLKLTAEERVSHLDGALKECTRQIRNVKEESELKLQETILGKTKQWDKLKLDFEAKIGELDRALLRAGAENAALSRSLQEHLSTIMSISEEKSHTEAEVELLKGNLQLREKEISSLKYELHVVSKEIDIRNQEKNMNLKATEAANKQQLENVRRIAKLEAECQRLRGLVRKKLPGPAALARMRSEVDSFGQDWNEPSSQRYLVKNPAAPVFSRAHIASDNLKQCHRESEFEGKRVLEMEEEIMTLREALAARTTELQASRSMYTKTTSRLKILEAQVDRQAMSSSSGMPIEGFPGQVESTPPSVISVSEDGIDEEGSSTGSWGPLISDISQLWKDKSIDKSTKSCSVNPMELMDDFLEMEKLACSSADSNSSRTGLCNRKIAGDIAALRATTDVTRVENEDSSQFKADPQSSHSRFSKLFSGVCTLLERQTLEADVKELLDDIKQALAPDSLHLDSESRTPENEKEASLADSGSNISIESITNAELGAAVSKIHQFVLSLDVEAVQTQGTSSSNRALPQESLQDFTASVEKFRSNTLSLVDFVLELSNILKKVGEADFGESVYANRGGDASSCDCIDKAPLMTKEVIQDELSSKDESCAQDPKGTKLELQETEQLLAVVQSQLESSQRSHSLAEIQLKCMTESYKLLETRAHDLEIQVNLLHDKAEKLEKELLDEKHRHQDTLAKLEEFREKFARDSVFALATAADSNFKTKQEMEIAAASEKLAECQETIHLLSRQLQAMRPHSNTKGSLPTEGRLVEDRASL